MGLVGKGLGGWYCNVPIPYTKYCRVEVEGNGVKFYQVNFQKYIGEKKVQSYSDRQINKTDQILQEFGNGLLKGFKSNNELNKEFNLKLKAGEEDVAIIEKPFGQIDQLVIETTPEKLEGLLKSRIKIFWDDNEKASIDVPVHMFFAVSDINNLYYSLYSGYKDGKLFTNLPMPFLKNAKIKIEVSDEDVELKISFKLQKRLMNSNYNLTAFYNEELPTANKDKPFLWLNTKGEGHYVGTFLMTEAKTQGVENLPVWLEGDEVFVCDGKMRIHGTGTEDYFNCGWYGVPGRLFNKGSFPLHGFPQYEMKEVGKASAYRWHLLDPIPFKDSIHVSVEHGTNNTSEANYKSIAFYYLKKNKY